MASKKSTPKASTTTTKKSAPKATSTPVRHTAIPRVVEAIAAAPAAAVAPRAVTGDMIAARAYEIWSANGGNEVDNWFKAEAELRAA